MTYSRSHGKLVQELELSPVLLTLSIAAVAPTLSVACLGLAADAPDLALVLLPVLGSLGAIQNQAPGSGPLCSGIFLWSSHPS